MRNQVSGTRDQVTGNARRRFFGFSLAPGPWPLAPRAHVARGFTLIEMLVSVALFAIVMVVCAGALLSLASANRKAQALQSVMNNLNVSVDGMVRNLREGTAYECGDTSPLDGGGKPRGGDCGGGDVILSFIPYGAAANNSSAWVYKYDSATHSIQRSRDNGNTFEQLTAPEVSVTDMRFFVIGARPGDTTQPRVIIVIKGTAGADPRTTTTFHLEATAVERALDI